MQENTVFLEICNSLIKAYQTGKLGQTKMPEDSHPAFSVKEKEFRLAYFTFPMALNYQRDSYALWQAALKTFEDIETRYVFNMKDVCVRSEEEVRKSLMKYKLALQPNKHVTTWRTIAKTINNEWGTMENLFTSSNSDFLTLKKLVQKDFKKGFPYLSGPKIFNYWSFILSTYGGVKIKNREYINIAPDTHITQCSIRLKVITETEAKNLSREQISERWRQLLKGSTIDPIDMHSPLWFWSRNGFIFTL